jgi:hypothetical protein
MPTKVCPSGDNKPIAQTLFLGASVASFTSNFGWGTQPSQLTVNLVEDELVYSCDPSQIANQPNDGSMYQQFAGNINSDDHYTLCSGVGCFIDKYTGSAATVNTPIENRIVPGKVYYELSETKGLISKYWKDPDPGFFGRKTRIKEENTYSNVAEDSHPGYKYDIIDTPVYFKMGDFQFGGFVQSWSRDIGSGGKNYTVIINGPQSILNSSYIIVDKYAGSIFSKAGAPGSTSIYGGPKNYLKSLGANYSDTDLKHGTIPNIFNIYGFLESFGEGNYGIARPDDRGVSINSILDALMMLTSITHDSTSKLDTVLGQGSTPNRSSEAIKRAFSPFGRIISKCMQREDNGNLYEPITSAFNRFGVVYPQTLNAMSNDTTSTNRCQFVLDLHDVIYTDNTRIKKRLPNDIRTTGPFLSITDLLNDIGERAGCDFSIEMIPRVYSTKLYHVIKVKAISRLKQPSTNLIENTIKSLECNNYQVSSNTIGKEKNDTPSRCLVIGGQQQRLYQVKSYRLAYTQNNFIYNPRTRKFVNYYSLADGAPIGNDAPTITTKQYGHGKIRFPNFNSSRNKKISDYLGTSSRLETAYVSIINDEDTMQTAASKGFGTKDDIWNTKNELLDGVDVNYGNYEPCFKNSHAIAYSQTDTSVGRWFPLYLDNICPFFGFVYDNKIGLKVGANDSANTDFRRIRPVWYDTWTSQISIIVRISELPKLNVPISRAYLETGAGFALPQTANLDPPTTTFNNLGILNSYDPVEFFVLTESEIRAAIAGFDNYLVYSLAKTYKPDLIELIRRAYYIKTRNELVNNMGMELAEAEKIAFQETDWYWKLLGPNIAGDELYPTAVYPDKNDGSQYIQEKALQDLKILHKFIMEIAKYYGKKYMVSADQLRTYRENSVTGFAFPTNVGYGYIFSGDGNLRYNYTPTNDGAWEEYGNIIDDSMAVGGTQWMTLTDDTGKIQPLLGYNNNYNYDYIRQAKCVAANKTTPIQDIIKEQANPYFSYDSWLTLNEYKTKSCTDSYIFPSLDISSLSNNDYVIVDQKYISTAVGTSIVPTGDMTTALTLGSIVKSYDAWGAEIVELTGTMTKGISMPRSKLYVSTSVEESFIYIDPTRFENPKILIDSPGINLNLSSEENAKDPNRTVISNISAEDLMIYLKTTREDDWDMDWIRYMLNYISPIVLDDQDNPYFLGLYTVSSNHTANNVELAPKAAHPFFAGIPIKSNQFVYGPWTNYPALEGSGIFPSGQLVTQSSTFPLTCTYSSRATKQEEVDKALNNLISNINIEFNDDFVPWNYGGMHQLDVVAFKEIQTKVNYQSVIETAQLDMPGLPLFNIGGNFALANTGLHIISPSGYDYKDVKDSVASVVDLSYIPGATMSFSPNTKNTVTAKYKVLDLKTPPYFVDGPIITSIQTSVGQQGISTTYSFRTYTRKLGLFNKEETDRIRRANRLNLKRGKQIAQISQEITNLKNKERDLILQERLNNAQFGSSDLSSKLFSWSPSTVLVGQASPLINEPSRTPKVIDDFSISSSPGAFNTRTSKATKWALVNSSDVGQPSSSKLETASSVSSLKAIARVTSTVQLFQRKELENQLSKDYGMQSAMSLDGILSPVSFYPTFKNSTFSYSLHNTSNCPFCRGTKVRDISVVQYNENGDRAEVATKITCDKCGNAGEKLNAKIVTDEDIPINLITLNPIVVPYGEFKNSNSQNYTGAHPDGAHEDIGGLTTGGRIFRDRLRHCIEIVARGSVPQNQAGYKLETSRNLRAHTNHPVGVPSNNLDYYPYDESLYHIRDKASDSLNMLHENNQRFFGLRGPLTLHAWGYDADGYPVPNAADEPLAYDNLGRPKRFKLKLTNSGAAKKYSSLSVGELFTISGNTNIFAKTFNYENLPSSWSSLSTTAINNSDVTPIKIEDNMDVDGGYDPGNPPVAGSAINYIDGFKGSIISKTQKFNGKWSEKVKLNDFYLNWAERPDLWKVGPIDLIWDQDRMVWAGGGGGEEIDPPYILTNSNDITTLKSFLDKKAKKKYIYRMIYATLEEDLIKQPDFDETYVTRGYIDDIEFSSEPLRQGYRRLIYIKDKTGYCAPRGTKLLCRYNKKTGFYEPVSKPSLIVKGKITSATQTLIDMHYVQGRRSGVVPTMTVNFDNPLGFTVTTNAIAIFTFLNGKWTLTAIK